jgi:hypothetical protein
MKIFSLHLLFRCLPNSFNNVSIGKIQRTVVDAWQTTGRYLVWKKRKQLISTALLAFYYIFTTPPSRNHGRTIVKPFSRPLSPLKPALTPHAPAIRPRHETSSKTLYLKGTVSSDRFQKFWKQFTELDLTKGRGWFLNFLGAPVIL